MIDARDFCRLQAAGSGILGTPAPRCGGAPVFSVKVLK
jgi:hypothetical protein